MTRARSDPSGPEDEDDGVEPADPHPDTPDDFEDGAYVRESEEAVVEIEIDDD